MNENTRESKTIKNIEKAEIEVIKSNENNLVLWTRPNKIKDNWYNAILQKPKATRKSNIQFIMRCNLAYSENNQTSYIVVSKDPMNLNDSLLNEVNEIIDYTDTHFYINIAKNPIQYGVRVNIADKEQMQEIIDQFKKERKEQIEAWNEEQRQRNLKIQKIL